MNSEQIRKWRPNRFSEIAGSVNQRRLGRIQRKLLEGRLPTPLLLVGIYGYGKTSMVRLMLKSLCCKNRDAITADPCNDCQWCRCFGGYYHGYGEPYRRYEYDCTSLSRGELIGVLNEHRFSNDEVLFMDELHHLHEKLSQEPMLKFVEDFNGLLVAAIMQDRLPEVIPPLRERFEVVQVCPPTEEEIIEFFEKMGKVWDVRASKDVIQFMVRESGGSFRFGIKAFAAAADEPGRILTKELVKDMLGLDPE